MTLARYPFWLDGGYDRDAVEACQYHPFHKWWEFEIGEVLEPSPSRDPREPMCICRGCYVPRCGHVASWDRFVGWTREPNPCILPRHHDGHHVTQAQLDALNTSTVAPDAPPAS